jgi:hypothetical protein
MLVCTIWVPEPIPFHGFAPTYHTCACTVAFQLLIFGVESIVILQVTFIVLLRIESIVIRGAKPIVVLGVPSFVVISVKFIVAIGVKSIVILRVKCRRLRCSTHCCPPRNRGIRPVSIVSLPVFITRPAKGLCFPISLSVHVCDVEGATPRQLETPYN